MAHGSVASVVVVMRSEADMAAARALLRPRSAPESKSRREAEMVTARPSRTDDKREACLPWTR